MLSFDFGSIAKHVVHRPKDFVAECNHKLQSDIDTAAFCISNRICDAPVILLAGPSGSGKTTSAMKIKQSLSKLGISAHVLSMDNYYKDVDRDNQPRDEQGHIDFESPELLDTKLLIQHFVDLAKGREILVPYFDFPSQKRAEKVTPLKLGDNEVAIYEGIHALNPTLTATTQGHAQRLYVSARTGFTKDGSLFFEKHWLRLCRRIVRDEKFRGADADYTLNLWPGVRRGEVNYIAPFKANADYFLDTALPYEPCVFKGCALEALESIPEDLQGREELLKIHPRLSQYPELSVSYLPEDSLVREFVGGGIFEY